MENQRCHELMGLPGKAREFHLYTITTTVVLPLPRPNKIQLTLLPIMIKSKHNKKHNQYPLLESSCMQLVWSSLSSITCQDQGAFCNSNRNLIDRWKKYFLFCRNFVTIAAFFAPALLKSRSGGKEQRQKLMIAAFLPVGGQTILICIYS